MAKKGKKEIVAKKILIFGTFDGVHAGHLNMFAQARNLSQKSFLIASVARDVNVIKIKKYTPIYSERTRKKILEQTGQLDQVVLGAKNDYLKAVLKISPDIIALGYDQKAYTKDLFKSLLKQGLKVKIVRLKSYKPRIYKNHLINKQKLV